MYKVILILGKFFLKYQIDPPPQEKLPSKSPALLWLSRLTIHFWWRKNSYKQKQRIPILIRFKPQIPVSLWLPNFTSDPRNPWQSYNMTFVSFILRFFLLPWCSINHLTCVIIIQITLLSLCVETYNQCNFQQKKLSISITQFISFSACLVMLCL